MGEKDVKILFRFFNSVLDEWTVETLWATVVDLDKGLYKLNNIPFYAPASCDDVIFAEYDQDEERLTYRETIEHSGNSTIQVFIFDESIDIENLREEFKVLGCDSEKFDDSFFALEIPAKLDYKPIRQKLLELEQKELISYAEPNLANNHWYD